MDLGLSYIQLVIKGWLIKSGIKRPGANSFKGCLIIQNS